MNGIDPRLTFWFGVWTSVLLLVASGTINFTGALPDLWVPIVTKWCGILGAINSTILTAASGYSSSKSGPMIGAPVVTPTIVRILIAAFALSLFLPSGSAQAQSRPRLIEPATPTEKCLIPWDPLKLCGTLTGKPEEDMQRVIKRIQGIGRDDMNYAILKATAANTNAGKVRLQCLNAIMEAKNAAEGTGIKDASGNLVPRPDPAIVTTMEDVAELVDALSPQGPLMTGCAGAAQLFKMNTLAVVNGFVTGAAGIAALPAGL